MSAQPSIASRPSILDALEGEVARAQREDRVPYRFIDGALFGPLREFLGRPGKSIRSRLVLWGWRAAGGTGEPPPQLGALIELLHAGSLVIDDVEDDATVRRGAPAMHRLHGAPLAINAGNWLYFWAIAQLQELTVPPAIELSLHRRCVATLLRCHRGQALDLGVRIEDVPQHEALAVVTASTRAKTGALVGLATSLGATLLGAPHEVEGALCAFGEDLGVVLQMLDDLSSVTSRAMLDKGREDVRASRPTWPWAWVAGSIDARSYDELRALAVEVARREAKEERVIEALRSALPMAARALPRGLAREAIASLRRVLPAIDVAPLEREITRMERRNG